MQIVIKIDDDMYKQIMADDHVYVLDDVNILLIENAIYNGTPLPKNHGRLIDADDVKENHRRWLGYLDTDMIERLNIAIDNHVPTIIEGSES